jgi:Domain of unknown function (DUF6468)
MSVALSLFFDGTITCLLIGAIAYMAILSRRLVAFRAMKPELEQVLANFGEAAQKADMSIARLKAGSKGAMQLDKEDRERIDRALGVRDDLAFLLERGNQLADRLEADVRLARDAAAASAFDKAVTAFGETTVDPKPFATIRGPAAFEIERAGVASETERVLREALKQARS